MTDVNDVMKVADDAIIAERWNEHHDPDTPAVRLEKVPPLCGQPNVAPAITSEVPHSHLALGL